MVTMLLKYVVHLLCYVLFNLQDDFNKRERESSICISMPKVLTFSKAGSETIVTSS